MSRKNNAARLTVCAMLCALGVVLLLLGSFVEVIDISMAVIASLLCVFAVIEYGGSAPWLVFAVTAILSLLLLPNKTPAVMYAFFFGYYPILKEKLEKLQKVLSWTLKIVIFNIALVLVFLAVRFVLMPTVSVEPLWLLIPLIALAEAVFVLYDIAMTRLITFYIVRLRERFKFRK